MNDLGVDTDETPRVGENDEALPETYSPLGTSPELDKVDELLLLGLRLEDESGTATGSRLTFLEQAEEGDIARLHALEDADNPWARETLGSRSYPRTLRDAAAADTDGDGFQETALVFMSEGEVTLKLVDDQAASYAESETRLTLEEGVLDLQVASGDFDGDGTDELVIGLSKADEAKLLFVSADGSGGFALDSSLTQTLSPAVADSQLTLELATGNLDYDGGDELAVILNEYLDDGFDGDGVSRYFLYDDATTDHALLRNEYVETRDGPTRSAVTANLALGDIDADGLDEVVIAGLANYGRCDAYGYLFIALDDGVREFAPLGSDYVERFFSNCPAFSPWRLRYLHVNALDLDDDNADEVQVNQFVFDSWNGAAPWTEIYTLPETEFFEVNDFGWYDRSTSAIVTGDVTGDGRDNIISYHQNGDAINIWGVAQDDPDERLGILQSIPVEFVNAQDPVNPVVLPVNLDVDSPLLKLDAGTHELVFTEPILIAALAAAPCSSGIGQNTDACTTSFGRGESSTIDASLTVSIKASVHTGVNLAANIPFVPESGVALKQTVTAKASVSAGTSYTLEKTITFSTGPLEDAVIFTTVPYDRYTYTVLSHPDPDLVGSTVAVSQPREPITLIADREFYNAALVEGALDIGSNVFTHLVGDHTSYPSGSRKNQLLGRYGGLENGPVSVGQGSGDTSVRIAVEEAISVGGSLGIEVERSVEVTAGPAMAGFSWGVGVEANLGITSGELTEYVGTVGSIDAANFSANQYSFGLFTYPYEEGGQAFQVLNYWVE